MRNPAVIATLSLAAATAACGQARGADAGPTVSRDYQVGGFNEIELAGRYDVQVRTGAKPSVSARGPEKLIERLVVEVEGDKLLIHPRKERSWFRMGWSSKDKIAVTVTVPNLEGATLAGSGGINVDKVQGERFNGQIAGSGDLRLGTIDVGLLKLGIAGSGAFSSGSGRARNAEYDIAGSGKVDAQGISAEDLKISVAGSGDIRAHATKTAKVDIVGSGDVEVTGGARCTVSKAGSGDVRCS
jgi:hypothetical protein